VFHVLIPNDYLEDGDRILMRFGDESLGGWTNKSHVMEKVR